MYTEDFDKMRNQIHRLMGEFFKEAKPLVGYQADESFHPPMDIYETEANLVIVMEIAGMRTEDMNVLFEKDHLSISGTRAEACPTPKTRLHQMEVDYGYFERTLRIPFPLKVDEVRATYRDGFLMITIPKREERISKTVEVSIR